MTLDEVRTFLTTVLTSGTFWSGVGAVAGMAAAIAAFMAIAASNSVRKEEIESNRPYFVIRKPLFSLDENNKLLLNINILNEGVRPASNVIYKMEIFPTLQIGGEKLPSDVLFYQEEFRFEHSSDLPRNVPFPWWHKFPVGSEIAEHFIKLDIIYADALLQKEYKQVFFMHWKGAQNGSATPDLTFASKLQAEAIVEHLMLRGVDKN